MDIDKYFEQRGSGEPIVFIHGSYATTSTWKKIIEALAVDHLCLSIKLPGHCGTPDPIDFANPNIETELKIIEQAIRRTTDRPVHLVGHSYGGVVALALALKGSITLKQLTLFEPVAVWVLRTMNDAAMYSRVEEFLSTYRKHAALNLPNTCGEVIDFWGNGNHFASFPARMKSDMALLLQNNLRHWDICTQSAFTRRNLNELSCPTHLVGGSNSNPVAQAIADYLVEEIPNSRKTTIEGATHFMVTSHAEDCIQLLNSDIRA